MRVRLVYPLVACCFAFAVAIVALSASAEGPKAANGTVSRWDHSALTHDGADVGNDDKLSKQIIRLGNEGWELADVSTVVEDGTTVKTVFYFKRPK